MASGPNGILPSGAPPPPPPTQRLPAEPPRTVKPKRLKAHTVTTRSFNIPMVPRDKKGKPMLPLNVGIMTVINLGEVCMREHFHTERYIFPVGYEVTRRYLSTINPGTEVVYHCTILDGGDGPKFQIIPSDRADKPIIAGTATGAWSNIVKHANAIRNRQHSNSVSGPDFFGLGQNTIKHLIQELPNSDRLRDYVWQNFVEGGPLGGRHAAVIPVLPEEYDASMPIGAYYPKREVSANPGVSRGLSHYPQHIIAQAEAQKSQQLAIQQAKETGASTGSSSLSSPQQQEGSTLSQTATQGNHVQIALPPSSSSEGLNIQHYQPTQQVQAPSQGSEKRATRSSTNNVNTFAPSGSGRNTRTSARGSQRQPQQQQQRVSASAAGTSVPSASEAMPTTFVGIMSQFPVPGLTDTPHSAVS
ncbi:hypothetical protein BYT27DRAFT_7220736 [Phlegmacium glaucopus]|nr:hypothetical protein BYT27DRAFT_7220736 [Phlegmacium glaucopus]